ncbi:MAG: hypothetical protein Terrestrivirus4_121 [Terrestrivirus sp.]|uniref:Uncharacterized protein n=1 Tax=Terrestrivirus sp. TaxID=2487775 RepID=A0A3G4ZR53_9VIRU|nr:MAG: hypothetical protein Terrestrivirus4_121 [Terrestrivirus sp.]
MSMYKNIKDMIDTQNYDETMCYMRANYVSLQTVHSLLAYTKKNHPEMFPKIVSEYWNRYPLSEEYLS